MKRRAIIIGLLALAAWLPSLEPYTAAAEDFGGAHVATASVAAYWAWFVHHVRIEGIWRIVGLPITDLARHTHPLAFPILSIVFHAANGMLLMAWLSRLRVGAIMLLVAPVLFVVLPSAIEANMYAVAAQSLLTTTVFLLLACSLTSALEERRASAVDIALCLFAAFLGNAIQENLLFAYVGLPAAIAYVQRPLSQWDKTTVRAVSAYTAAGVAAVLLFAAATLEVGTEPTKSPSLNLETIASFVVYQVTNLIPFEFWRHRDLIGFTLEHQSWLRVAIGIALVVAGVAVTRTLRMPSREAPASDVRRREWRLLQAMLMLWLFAGLVYVIAGGYSFESRKKYVTLAFMAPVIAYAAARAFDAATSVGSRRMVIAAVAATIAICAGTTWMVASMWILTAQRGDALVKAIATTQAQTVLYRRHPNVYEAWPRWRDVASSQHNASWVTEFEMLRRFNRTVKMVEEGEPSDVIVDCETRTEGPLCVVTVN